MGIGKSGSGKEDTTNTTKPLDTAIEDLGPSDVVKITMEVSG